MDGFVVLMILFAIVNVVLKAAKKQQAGSKGRRTPEQPWQRMLGDIGKSFQGPASEKQPDLLMTPLNPVKSAAPKVYREGTGKEGQYTPGSLANRQQMSVSISPRLGEGESAPLSAPGSLAMALDAEAVHPAGGSPMPAAAQPSASALHLAFNRDALLQAVVMHEILTRPQDRKRRWSVR